ncbi:unnamed protein product [Phytophthora fragariaefolia]|uniref:Unnamed protein product n=1 Tax=Phytophthora fragariaefolia TaxID=1490495 RepID=A0A9W6YEA8_9STRA|nr:unnamed protein product [Phytophthora fragariaefolia]
MPLRRSSASSILSGDEGSAMSSAHAAAEAQKTLGNEEFNDKNFAKAVECYSEVRAPVQGMAGKEAPQSLRDLMSCVLLCVLQAIRLDPESFVYYSNRRSGGSRSGAWGRGFLEDVHAFILFIMFVILFFNAGSAAYGALGKWELAEADAQQCVKRNPQFAKGYHRLANAQQQLGRKQEAIETLKTAQATAADPEKVPGIKKLLRQLNQEVAPKSAGPAQGGRQVPAHIAKELQELQPQFQKIQRELEQIEAKLAAYARQKKRLALVDREVADLPEGTKTYRSIGKMFLQTTSDENAASMKEEEKRVDDQVSSLEARKNYLLRQKQSAQDNITELLAQCT